MLVSMIYDGKAIQCSWLQSDPSVIELCFNLKDDSVNKFNELTLRELSEAVGRIKAESAIRGLLITSAKDVFIVGADVTEFLRHFKKPESELITWLGGINRMFSDIEDLKVPSVCAINGFGLGGGFELALSASYRVMSAETKVGQPETKLGIIPGWGGTVRLSRLIGADNAIEWIASGEQYKADAALKVGAVDAVVPTDQVRATAIGMLQDAIAGKLDWKSRQAEKIAPLKLNPIESTMVFEGAKAFVGATAGPNYPAPVAAIEAMQKGASLSRDQALGFESIAFAKMAHTQTARALVGLFLGDQYLKKASKKFTRDAKPVNTAAVLGAGIMGGGVAYQSASRGVPIYMKDIAEKALQLGLSEAGKILEKQVSRGKMTPEKLAQTMGRIRPTLSYGDFKNIDLVVEAVTENEAIKKKVLVEAESQLQDGAVLTSNTSSISITGLAEPLKHPEKFCGMHFFNPVHKMPLVEIIRGKKTDAATIATTVAYALALGKTPIVVNDCAGFLVNRILFPYLTGFNDLVRDGVAFERIDKVMEKFGWPMGPAYLADVVGIDTAVHVDAVMAKAYPDRMVHQSKTAIEALYEAKRYGQKNGLGFYKYSVGKKGFPEKSADPTAQEVLKVVVKTSGASDITDQTIVDRMMIPLVIEASRCLEDQIVASPVEVDLGLIYGLGFPPFRGGAFQYADTVGLAELCRTAEQFKGLGKLYEPTAQMQNLAKAGRGFYSDHLKEMGAVS